MNKERIDVRVEPELLEELDAISERQGLGSRSAAIREAIASYVIDNKEGWNSTGIKVNIPNRIAERLQRQIMNGDAMDIDNAITLALDFWLRDIESYYLGRRRRVEKAIQENLKSDDAMKELEERAKDLGRP
jgi:predicted DNA-binding protein